MFMWTTQRPVRHLRAVVLLAAAFAQVGTAVAYDANADFPPGALNPNGVWRYGYTTSLGSAFILHNEYATNSAAYGWRTNIASFAPAFFHTNTVINGMLPGEIGLHGGPNGEFSVLRFTTPTTGLYDISASWRGPGDLGNTDLYLLKNSNGGSPLAGTGSTTISGGFASIFSMPLVAGDTIDLALGTGGDGFNFDSTPVSLQITPVPEPAAATLIVAALLSLAAMPARRRRD